jgi:hypothetical protein
MGNLWYKLVDKVPVPCEDLEGGKLWETENRRVAETKLPGGFLVSTIFLGLDHRFDEGPPLVFETMVFRPEVSGYQDLDMDRYSTWDEAEEGHKKIVDRWYRRIEKIRKLNKIEVKKGS